MASPWKSGVRLTSSFGGWVDFAEEVISPQHSGRCEIIVPCYGDRIFAQTQDHKMAFAIQIQQMREIIEGLKGRHEGENT
jgi:uncharacterized protein (DUF169 family)